MTFTRMFAFLLAASALSGPAFAYETDQLTDRTAPLDDVTIEANARVDALLAEAVAATNRRTACAADDDTTRRVLAREIAKRAARPVHVSDRGAISGLGFGAYAAWLETADLDRRSFPERDDIYGGLAPQQSVILGIVGACSTFRIADVRMGSDKPDHFWSEGYRYAVASRWGRDPERAIRLGTTSELTYYGLMTSNTFSYADLAANWDGYTFYVGLLGDDSILRRGDDGCVEQVGSFDWAEYADDAWDEVLNPSVYVDVVAEGIRERLTERRDEVCAEYATWGAGYEAHLAAVLSSHPDYAGPKAPPRVDPYGLTELCGAPAESPPLLSDAGE